MYTAYRLLLVSKHLLRSGYHLYFVPPMYCIYVVAYVRNCVTLFITMQHYGKTMKLSE